MDKLNLRDTIKNKRLKLSLQTQLDYSTAIYNRLIKHNAFRNSQHIGCYLAMNGEVSTNKVIETIWAQQKKCYLPILHENKSGYMSFAEYKKNDELVKNRFNIPEPKNKQNPMDAKDLDLVITPLVAFDDECNRLGMGAGFYDRSFAFLNIKPRPHKPMMVGVAYDFQKTDKIQPQSWDVAMDFIITNNGVSTKL